MPNGLFYLRVILQLVVVKVHRLSQDLLVHSSMQVLALWWSPTGQLMMTTVVSLSGMVREQV